MSELASEVAELRRRALRLERRVADALEVVMEIFGLMQDELGKLGEYIPADVESGEEKPDVGEKGK